MSSRVPAGNELSMAQVQADLYSAKAAMEGADSNKNRLGKYLKGLAAYHLQQAAEKMVKIQIYRAGVPVDYAKIYKHNIRDLVLYGTQIGVKLEIPAYVRRNDTIISSWEAEGRYGVHIVVRSDTLRKAYEEIQNWWIVLKEKGYK